MNYFHCEFSFLDIMRMIGYLINLSLFISSQSIVALVCIPNWAGSRMTADWLEIEPYVARPQTDLKL